MDRVRQYKAPYRYAKVGGKFVLLERKADGEAHKATKTVFKSEADAKKQVLAMNNEWRRGGGKRQRVRSSVRAEEMMDNPKRLRNRR